MSGSWSAMSYALQAQFQEPMSLRNLNAYGSYYSSKLMPHS